MQARECEIAIYTTSLRGPVYLMLCFRLLGVRLADVVNGSRHSELQRERRFPRSSKYPPAFGVDLLVDDSVGVARKGALYNFDVVRIDPADTQWTQTVLDALDRRLNFALEGRAAALNRF